jgi:hypothetical protein
MKRMIVSALPESLRIQPLMGLALLLGLAVLSGCTERINTAKLGSNTTLITSPLDGEATEVPSQVSRFDWLRLAQRVGVRGQGSSPIDRVNRSSPRPGRQFIPGGNGSFPGMAMTSFPGGNMSFPRGNLSFPSGTSFPFAGNGSFPAGPQRWVPGGANSSLPYYGNSSFPAGGNGTYGQGRWIPPRGAGSRGLPLNSSNVTYGQGFPGFPGGRGSNSTIPGR